MSAITSRSAHRATSTAGQVTSAIGTGLIAAGQRLTGQTPRGTRMDIRPVSRRQTTQPTPTGNHWTHPIKQQPNLLFDKGDMAQMLDSGTVNSLHTDSPAAAVALMDFVAHQHSDAQGYAHARLTTLLQTSYPTTAAMRHSQTQRNLAQHGNGELTAQLTQCELDFLSLVHNTKRSRGIKVNRLAERLADIADAFGRRNSQRRQASSRIILADIYLRLRRFDDANREMSKALVLIGTVYGKSQLIELAQAVNGPSIIDETYRDAPDTTGADQARQLTAR